jgi:hypothetical protein
VTAGRRRERLWRVEGGGAACPSWALPQVSARPSGHLLREGGSEGLACRSLSLQRLHPLLQLPDTCLQVSVPGLRLLQLAVKRWGG